MPLTQAIQTAQAPSPWNVGNSVLYDLCSVRPKHSQEHDVIAKVWLIGRAYAAAIERRKNKTEKNTNDDFYITKVAPDITGSAIDSWINEAKQYERPGPESWSTLLCVHHKTTQLFSSISGLDKRSLASKYLHFHVPQLFYIYDARAVKAISMLGGLLKRAKKAHNEVDNEYRKFAEKCLFLQNHVESKYDVILTPREIDNLLLYVYANNLTIRRDCLR